MKRGAEVIPVAFTENGISLIKKFSHGTLPQLHILEDIQEAGSLAETKRAKAIVTGQTLNKYEELDTSLPVLRPLIAFTDEQIEDELKRYADL